jgi:Spy/CpxP family protein refolding chaperone
MHPGMMWWWKHARRHAHGCGSSDSEGGEAHAEAGPGGPRAWAGWHGRGGEDDFGGGGFGVRRPLRFLAYKLNLNEEQVADLAKILDELKTERAQAAVDDRRTVAAFADALGLEKFDEAKAKEGGDLRVKTAERLRDAVLKAISKIHAMLDHGQRAALAYLIRTGTLSL